MAKDQTRICVVDTDVLIGVLKQQTEALQQLKELKKNFMVATTVYNFFELFHGAYSHVGGVEFERVISLREELPALSFSIASAQRAGMISAQLERLGLPLSPPDVIIAAIALEHNAAVLTGNVKHFQRIEGVELL